MILRPATVADVDAVAALERDLFGVDAWSSSTVASELANASRNVLVATHGESLVGYVITMTGGDVVDLLRIAVHPLHRRHGIAHALLAEVLDRAVATGAERMLLEVSAANSAAVAFYASEGFAQLDRRPRYYRDGTDALVMGRRLGADGDGRR